MHSRGASPFALAVFRVAAATLEVPARSTAGAQQIVLIHVTLFSTVREEDERRKEAMSQENHESLLAASSSNR